MSEGCIERFYPGFMLYVLTFNLKKRKSLIRLIETQKNEKVTYVFRKAAEIDAFLAGLAS